MARHLGETQAAAEYETLFKKGKAWCDKNMFNGKWYCQKLDLPNGTIGFDPVLPGVFRDPWFAGGAWGEFERTAQKTCSPWRRARCI